MSANVYRRRFAPLPRRTQRARIRAPLLRHVACLGLLAAAAACTKTQPDFLMVPRNGIESHGFADKKLAESRYLVTYSGPEVTTDNTVDDQVRLAADTARRTAYDLALRRAAEIALARGYAAIAVASANVTLKQVIVGHDYHQNGNPVYDYVPGIAYGYATAMYLRPEATLTVDLLKQPTQGALDARATAERIKRQYAGVGTKPIAPRTYYYFGTSAIVHNDAPKTPRPAAPEKYATPSEAHPPYAGAAY
jgi:hypothetical protein